MEKRFYKSTTNEVIDGVCGGIAQYFNLDPTLVRLAWLLFTLAGGSGIIVYIICMVIMPEAPEPTQIINTSAPHTHATYHQN